MENTIKRLENLHRSVQKLETVLQEVWSGIDELNEDNGMKDIRAKMKQSKKQNSGDLGNLPSILMDYDQTIDEIPEDGTAAVDLEDAISELIEWMKNNK